MGLVLFGLAWLAADHYRPWASFHSEALALAGLSFLAIARLCSERRSFAISFLAVGAAVLACVPWVQWLGGVSYFAGDSLLATLYLFALALAIAAGHCPSPGMSSPSDGYPGYMHVLWIVAIVSAGIGLMQWLGVQWVSDFVVQADAGKRAIGNLAQPNQLATLLLMGIASLALAYEKKLLGNWAFFLSVAFLSIVVLLTGSRTGLVSVIALTGFLAWKNSRRAGRLPAGVVALWCVGCLVGYALMPLVHDALLLGSGRGVSLTDVDSPRMLIWQQVGYGVLQAPWLGYGWNETPAAHSAAAVAFPGSLTYTNAHNVVLDLVAWNGVPLGLLLVGICGWWLVSRIRRVEELHAVYGMACLLPLALHSMTEHPFAYAYFLIAGGLLIGLVEGSISKHKQVTLRPIWVWPPLVLWMVAAAWVGYEYVKVEEDFRIVRFESLRIGRTPSDYGPPRIYALSHMGAMLEAARISPTPGMGKEQLERLAFAARRFPYGVLAIKNAIALGLNGNPEAASAQMVVLRGMHGERYYTAAKIELRSFEAEYPQLKAVQAP